GEVSPKRAPGFERAEAEDAGTRDLEPGIGDHGSGMGDLGSGSGDREPGRGAGEPRPSMRDRGPTGRADGGVLVLSPNWLGDAVMALPAIADLKRHFGGPLVVAARASVAGM